MAVNGYLVKINESGNEEVLYPKTRAEHVQYDDSTTVSAKISSMDGAVNQSVTKVNTLETNLNAETTARTTADSALNARIDNLLSGTASEDTEVLDAHVNGVNAKTYTTLKQRLDGDFTDLKTEMETTQSQLSESIAEISNDEKELATEQIDVENYENGYITKSGTLNVSTTEYVHSKPFHLNVGDKVVANVAGYSTIVSIVAKIIDDTHYSPLVTSVDNDRHAYEYVATEECDAVVSFWLKRDRTVKVYTTIETVGNLIDEAKKEIMDYSETAYPIWKSDELDNLYEAGLIDIRGNLWGTGSEAYKHISIPVVAGERYLISGSCNNPSYSGAWYSDANGFKEYVYNVSSSTFEDLIVVIPIGVTTLTVNGSNTATQHALKAVKQTRMNGDYIGSIEKSISENTDNDTFERMCLRDRCLRAEKGNDFAWSDFDKAYFVFVNDDVNSFFPSCKALFEMKNVPLCSAVIVDNLGTVYSGQTKSVETLLHEMVSNGGEVLAHYNYNLYENSTDAEWYEHAVKPKKILVEHGFVCDGLIRANSTTVSTKKGEQVCRDYYRYSDTVGISTQYLKNRKFFIGVNTLDEIKTYIDDCCNRKGFFPFCFHGNRTDEPLATVENLSAIIDYINSKGASVAEIGTYKSVYDAFGTTVLEKRLSALENK